MFTYYLFLCIFFSLNHHLFYSSVIENRLPVWTAENRLPVWYAGNHLPVWTEENRLPAW
jgi:hypothetical protein